MPSRSTAIFWGSQPSSTSLSLKNSLMGKNKSRLFDELVVQAGARLERAGDVRPANRGDELAGDDALLQQLQTDESLTAEVAMYDVVGFLSEKRQRRVKPFQVERPFAVLSYVESVECGEVPRVGLRKLEDPL